jgi:glycosyltransferase involved in cell wall biosynthesis
MGKTSVLITTEGTYPCYSGGVSVWCDYLLRQLDDVAFHVFALIHAPAQEMQFACPPNVGSCILHPMWGTEEPGTSESRFIEAHQRKLQTSEADINVKFLPLFKTALASLMTADSKPDVLASSLGSLHRYFRDHDYAMSMRSRPAWEAFLNAASASDLRLDLHEATQCMRWLQRYLSLLAVRFPNVDIVHGSMAGLASIPGVLCKLSQGSSFVLTEHGIHLRELYLSLSNCGYSEQCRAFLIRFHHAVARMNYHFADVVTTLGEFNRKWQVRFGADVNKIQTIPNGVDPGKFYPRPSEPRTRPSVLTMARIFRLKGIDVLIKAAAQVRDELPDVLFRILGDVADQQYFEECQQLVVDHDLANNVSFGVTREAANAYSQCDLLCVPSLSEGLPFVVIEAMLSGCPVVATDVGNVADLLKDTGLVVTPNSPDELAAALLLALNSPDAEKLRCSLARSALERASQHFTIDQFSSAFRSIYKELRIGQTTATLSRAAS